MRGFCVPGAIIDLPSKPACGNCRSRSSTRARVHRKLAGAQDLIHARIDERRQRHRPDDRDAVFEVAHQLRVAAGEDQLVDRDLHGDRR